MKITPKTYIDMNKEFEENGDAVRIVVPTQEGIDKWREWSKNYQWNETPKGVDMVAEMWAKLGVYTLEEREKYRMEHGGL